MAKELPYFKFEPNQWENGNIQLCNRESKGLFIELCSIYWSRLGELPYALALQKLCNGNELALKQLKDNDIFIVENGNIVIDFLDEQLSEFQETSKKRTLAANKRWSNANALQIDSKSNAIRGEEIREEKIRKEKKKKEKKVFVPPTLDEVKLFFKEKGYQESLAIKAFNYYNDNEWKDSRNNNVLNWKMKFQNNWFKDDFKVKPESEKKEYVIYSSSSGGGRMEKTREDFEKMKIAMAGGGYVFTEIKSEFK